MFKVNKKFIIWGFEILVILGFGLITFMATRAQAADKYYFATDDNGAYLRRYVREGEEDTPYIAYINPKGADELTERVRITITGDNFNESSVVKIDGINHSSRFIDPRHMQFDIRPGEIADNQAEFYVSVYNRDEGEYSNAASFSIKANADTVKDTKSKTSYGYSNYSTDTNYNYKTSGTSYSVNKTAAVTTTANTNTAVKKTSNRIETKDDINEEYEGVTANAMLGYDSFLPSGLMQWLMAIVIIFGIIFLFRYVYGEEDYQSKPLKHA